MTRTNTGRRFSRNVVLILMAISFAIGAGAGVAGWIFISGGSGEASEDIGNVAPTLSLDDPTEAPETAPTQTPHIIVVTATPDEAEVSTAPSETPVPETEDTVASRTLFRIDQELSQTTFTLEEDLEGARTLVVGTTDQVGGDIIVNFDDPAASEIGMIVINARTLETPIEFRNRAIRSRILRSAEDAYEFITFIPTELIGLPTEPLPMGVEIPFQIVGELTIVENTLPVTFDAVVTVVSDSRIEGKATAQVLRDDFNLVIPNAPGVANVTNEVQLEITFVAKQVEE